MSVAILTRGAARLKCEARSDDLPAEACPAPPRPGRGGPPDVHHRSPAGGTQRHRPGRRGRRRQQGAHPRAARPAVRSRLLVAAEVWTADGRRGGGRRAPARRGPGRPAPGRRRHRGDRADHGHPADPGRRVRQPGRALPGGAGGRRGRRGRCPRRPAQLPAVRHRAAPAPPGGQPGAGDHPPAQPAARPRPLGRAGPALCRPASADPAASAVAAPAAAHHRVADRPATRAADVFTGPRRLVVVGASTGGPPALATILADLPSDLPVPVLVVQHMADGFVEGLADWLNGLSALPVEMAQHGRRLRPGRRARRPGRGEHVAASRAAGRAANTAGRAVPRPRRRRGLRKRGRRVRADRPSASC